MATPTAGVSRQGHGIVAIVSAAPGANASQAAMYRSRAARRSSLRCRDSRCATCASAASAARCLASRARISSASNHADFSCQRRRLAFAFAAASSRALVSAANASALLRDISAATPPNQSPSSSLASAHPASSPQPYGSSPASNSASSAKRSRHAASEERPSESTTPGALEAGCRHPRTWVGAALRPPPLHAPPAWPLAWPAASSSLLPPSLLPQLSPTRSAS
mmetsp:Transcript_47852/g.107833  ORF Transcript_47852/g.107833 Transcript_47852/m.107833 type:complete len:223 (-) Transcript_47852:462-1130(-)